MLALIAIRPVLVTQILAIAFTAFELLTGKLKLPSFKQPWWLIMTGLLVAVTASNMANFRFVEAISSFNDFGKIYLTFIIIWINLNSVKRLEIFSIFLVAMGTFIALHCVLMHETGQGFGEARGQERYIGDNQDSGSAPVIQGAFYGIFGDPNDAAQLFAMVLPLCFFIMLRFRSILVRSVYLLKLVTLMLGVYSTESRGGFIALASVFFILLRSFLPMRFFIIISVVGALIIVAFAPARFSGGMIDTSSSHRVDFWGEATQAFQSNPLFGVGHLKVTEYTSNNKAVHNSYVQAYAELGIFGYTFWFTALAFSIYSMHRLSKALPENNEESSLILWMNCVTAGIIGGSVAGLFLSRAYILPHYVFMALTAACYSISSQKIGDVPTITYCRISPKHWFIWIGLSLFSMSFIYFSIIILNIIK
jgi:hypothetical protein